MELPRFGGRLRVVDLPVHGRHGLDPAFDARRQPVHRRPAAAADTEKKAQADHQGPEPRAPQQDAHPRGRRCRIGLDGTQRAACGGAQALAEPPQLAVAVSSICRRSASSWRPSREVKSFGLEVMLVQRSLQPPTAVRCPDRGRSRSSCPGAALQGRLPPGRRPRRRGFAPRRARRAVTR